jgi:hypothetical protein
MGRVYLGRSRGGLMVAVKVLRAELTEDPGFRLRFAREVDAARRVNGFFTAGMVAADPDGEPAWLATAYVPGVALSAAARTSLAPLLVGRSGPERMYTRPGARGVSSARTTRRHTGMSPLLPCEQCGDTPLPACGAG